MLSTYLIKLIFSHVWVESKRELIDYCRGGEKFSFVWGSNFALVNKQWFLITRELMISHSNVHINFLNHDKDEDEYDSSSGDDVHHDASIDDRKNDDNKCSRKRSLSCGQQQQQQKGQKEQKISDFKILTKKSVQHINVGLAEIGDCFEKINQCTSLRSITVVNSAYDDIDDDDDDYDDDDDDDDDDSPNSVLPSYHNLEVLNKLKRIDKINVNFFLDLFSSRELNIQSDTQAITFKFKTLHFESMNHCSCRGDESFNFIYRLINLLRPNSLHFYSPNYSHPARLTFFHSLSKLSFESVVIDRGYIPLYSLYRLLGSTRLAVFKFNLQFHFLSALYNINNNNNNNEINYDFNLMDTTDGQGINEDNHKYCPRCQSGPLNIPEYSRSLWKECLQLLKTNTTLTELSIGHSLCCHYGSTLNQQLIDDLLDSLSNNKSIKTLYLDFRGIDQPKQQHPFINEDFISSLLQNNTTIENLYIGCYWEKDLFDGIVKSKPLSSKCLIIDINPVPKPFDQTSWQMSYQFSSKAYQ